MTRIRSFRDLDVWKELKYAYILSEDLGYILLGEDLMAQAESVGGLLYGLVRSTERRIP